jgi:hypothetical protein
VSRKAWHHERSHEALVGRSWTENLDGRGGFRTCDLSRVKNEELADPDAESQS